MPITRQSRRISPLDINPNVRIGVAFPLDENNMFKGTPTTKEQVKSNLLNLLLTRQGERVNHPNFGIGLQHLLFESKIKTDELQEIIRVQINNYIPEIKLKETKVEVNEHHLFISISYTFKMDGTTDSIGVTI